MASGRDEKDGFERSNSLKFGSELQKIQDPSQNLANNSNPHDISHVFVPSF